MFSALLHKYFGHKNYQIFLRISRNQDHILHIPVRYYPHFTPIRSTLQIYKLRLNAQEKLGNKNISQFGYLHTIKNGQAWRCPPFVPALSETETSLLSIVSSKTARATWRDYTSASPKRMLKLIQEHMIENSNFT